MWSKEEKAMLRKLWISMVVLLSLLVACNDGGASSNLTKDETPDKGMEIVGEAVTFNPNKLVNDGEPITIELWTWGAEDVFQKQIDAYKEIYPNVDIKTVVNPWDEMWTKLPLALQGNDGPALFNIHNSQHDNLINFLAPYDIPLEDLQADFSGVDAHIIDGEVHYFDIGIMTGSIFYNKTLWNEAGLTEADIPKTWDQFALVAEQLTKRDDAGSLIQAGYNFNGDYQAMILGLPYQQESLLFDEDGQTINYDSDGRLAFTEYLHDLYYEDEVGSPNFGDDSSQSFGNEQSAMVYKWGWFQGELNNNYPDVEWGVFQTPFMTEDTPFAIDRYNGESTFGINKNASSAEQEVAQDFVRFVLAGDDFSVDYALLNSTFPTKYAVADHPDILSNPVLSVLAENIDRYMWPGPFPAIIETVSGQVFQEIFYNGKDIKSVLSKAQDDIENGMAQSNFTSAEKNYLHYND